MKIDAAWCLRRCAGTIDQSDAFPPPRSIETLLEKMISNWQHSTLREYPLPPVHATGFRPSWAPPGPRSHSCTTLALPKLLRCTLVLDSGSKPGFAWFRSVTWLDDAEITRNRHGSTHTHLRYLVASSNRNDVGPVGVSLLQRATGAHETQRSFLELASASSFIDHFRMSFSRPPVSSLLNIPPG